MNLFLVGAIAFSHWAAGLFFWRFWRTAKDRLFLFFATSFWIMGLEQFLRVFWGYEQVNPFIYLMRLSAYLLIIFAIVDKNRRR